MQTDDNNHMIHRLRHGEKQVILVGTAHVSRQSVDLVRRLIEEEKPDTVCVELCQARYQAMRRKDNWQNTDIVKVIREKKTYVLLSNLILAAFQRRIAARLDIQPGQEMLQAVESAEAIGAQVHLADRDIRTTLSRTLRSLSLWQKTKLFFQLLLSISDADDIDAEQIEKLKRQDVLDAVLSEIGQDLPTVRKTLIDERDLYMTARIRSAPGSKVLAVVGAGHLQGILRHWQESIDLEPLETIPPKSHWLSLAKWIIPLGILALLAYGFAAGGSRAGRNMLAWWVAANGILAGLGALAALAHPLTIASSVLAAPLTSLNPMIAAGWVSGLVEAFSRKPQVRDFETLHKDIQSFKGFWKNKVTRILLVVVFTNLGSSLGTFVALPLMMRAL